jgi:hypothetical protein
LCNEFEGDKMVKTIAISWEINKFLTEHNISATGSDCPLVKKWEAPALLGPLTKSYTQ